MMQPYRLPSLILLLILLLGPAAHPAQAAGWIYTVNSPNDGPDANAGDGVCATINGNCTLRAAIQESNAYTGPNTILFNLPGAGIRQILLTNGALPYITDQLKLDASTQPNCTVPCVRLDGGSLPAGPYSALEVRSDLGLYKGLILTSFQGYGYKVHGDGNAIESNYIGLAPGDASDLGNGGGLWILGANTVIGGTSSDKRNVISGNHYEGITLGNASSVDVSGTIIQGNYIGTDESGTAARPNGHEGIAVLGGSSNTLIGGTTPGAGNVISGNAWHGILLGDGNTTIQGNFIGTGRGGAGAVGNQGNGIRLWIGSTGNLIGGTSNAARNRIAYNGWNGISLTGSETYRASIRRNLIYSNQQLGIDLGENGVTANDSLDADSGPNGLQNFPVVISAWSGTSAIVARLNSKPNTTYTIDFFSSPAGSCDPSGHGEGRSFLGSKQVTTSLTGYVRFTFSSPIAFSAGSIITATATDGGGRTSEFSTCRTAQ